MSETHGSAKSQLADIILGGQDGLVNVLGVVLGIGAATTNPKIILAGGLAATFAESISMAAVAYTSKMAERDRFFAEKAKEEKEIVTEGAEEAAEIRKIYSAKGFNGKILEDIVAHITGNRELWLKTMMSEELGLTETKNREIYIGSVVVGASAIGGSLIPMMPFFFTVGKTAVVLSLVFSVIALAVIGIYKAKTTIGRPLRSAIEMVVIGMGAAFIGYGIGLLFR